MTQSQYLADFSLALINRTGAYHVCRDVVQKLPQFFAGTRYWRLRSDREPSGLYRKVLGKAMLLELTRFGALESLPRSRRVGRLELPTLFLDPLYVLHTRLEREDIVLCHDVGPITHLDLFDPGTTAMYRAAYAAIEKTGPGMVFVSEASRNEFVRCFGDRYRFLHVIPLYVRSGLDGGEETAPPGVTTPFLLTVGGLEKRKNHRRIIEAFVASGLRDQGYSYVLCGPRGNSADEVAALAAATPGVVSLGFLSDAEVKWLYHHASGFVLPSLLEGFGLPALEAAQRGLISIVSSEGAQPEAVGEGAVLVDATSVAAISAGMCELAEMPSDERARRLELAKAHAAKLTHDRFIASWAELLAAGRPKA